MRTILDAKYEKEDLNKVTKKSQNLTEAQRNDLLKYLQKPKALFDRMLDT